MYPFGWDIDRDRRPFVWMEENNTDIQVNIGGVWYKFPYEANIRAGSDLLINSVSQFGSSFTKPSVRLEEWLDGRVYHFFRRGDCLIIQLLDNDAVLFKMFFM